jgi:hypothetical protein
MKMKEDQDQSVSGNNIFREDYLYWRKTGLNHTSATNKAIDYYRKFTSREVTTDWEVFQETVMDNKSTCLENRVIFNDMIQKLVRGLEPKERKFLFLVVRQQCLYEELNEENQDLCDFYAGDSSPNSSQDIAAEMGFTVQSSGASVSVTRYKHRIQETLQNLGFGGI